MGRLAAEEAGALPAAIKPEEDRRDASEGDTAYLSRCAGTGGWSVGRGDSGGIAAVEVPHCRLFPQLSEVALGE